MPRKAPKSTAKKDRLTPQKRKAIELIAMGKRYRDVYEELGIGKSTLEAWRKQKIFAEELNKTLSAIEEESITRIKALQEKAITTLEDIMEQTR
jgi:transposase-like protein